MILILRIDGAITRSTIGTMGASKIRRQLRALMLFALPLFAELNKAFLLDITDKALLDQAIVIDLDSNTSTLSSGANTYEGEEVESMLGYIDDDAAVHAT